MRVNTDPQQRPSSHRVEEIKADDREPQGKSSCQLDEIQIKDREVQNWSDRPVQGAGRVTIVEDARVKELYATSVYYHERCDYARSFLSISGCSAGGGNIFEGNNDRR